MSPLRSLLFIPANQPRMLDKAAGLEADALVPDLEDSVPDAEKGNARETLGSYLPRLRAAGPWLVPRVNALDSDWLEADLEAVVGPAIDGVSVGKVHDESVVAAIGAVVARLERRAGVAGGSIRLIPWIESARGVVNAARICAASPRIAAVAFGAEDFTHDMGIERGEDDAEIAWARGAVCVAARAAGVIALDTPFFRFRDEAALHENVRAAKRLGFKGKFAIHPAQIAAINAAFRPSEAQLAHAREVVAAFERAAAEGRGSTSLRGEVIDVPVVKRARALLTGADGGA